MQFARGDTLKISPEAKTTHVPAFHTGKRRTRAVDWMRKKLHDDFVCLRICPCREASVRCSIDTLRYSLTESEVCSANQLLSRTINGKHFRCHRCSSTFPLSLGHA